MRFTSSVGSVGFRNSKNSRSYPGGGFGWQETPSDCDHREMRTGRALRLLPLPRSGLVQTLIPGDVFCVNSVSLILKKMFV